jgi:acylphosphatase
VIYSGSVQNVGFRYTSRSLAKDLGLTGWVRNVPDGSVEIVAEGEEKALNELLLKIKQEMNYTSFKEQASWMDATNEFEQFQIKF